MSDLRPPRYLKSMNRVVKAMQRLGVRTAPAMILTVPGRKTGKPRSTPMTPFTYRGDMYTVAGYPGADWAANARAAGAGTLTRGGGSVGVQPPTAEKSSRESRRNGKVRREAGPLEKTLNPAPKSSVCRLVELNIRALTARERPNRFRASFAGPLWPCFH